LACTLIAPETMVLSCCVLNLKLLNDRCCLVEPASRVAAFGMSGFDDLDASLGYGRLVFKPVGRHKVMLLFFERVPSRLTIKWSHVHLMLLWSCCSCFGWVLLWWVSWVDGVGFF